MRYKMLVLDMDDTLLDNNHKISEINKKALKKAMELGVYVVLASGRPTYAMIDYAKELNLDKMESYIISYNGAVIVDCKDDKVIFENSLTKQEIHHLYDFSKNHKVDILTYMGDYIVSENDSKYIKVEKDLTGMPHDMVSCFKTRVNDNGIKCIMLEEPSYLKEVEQKLKAAHNDKYSIAISKPFFLEVMPKGICKAKSIERLAKQLDIKQEEIIAVGNAGNDLSMVKYAGLGIFVDNVDDDLRKYADIIVASNEDNGVAEVVEKFILNS